MPRVDIAAAAQALEISQEAVRKRLYRGTLKGDKVGGRWWVDLEDTAEDTRQDEGRTREDALVEHLQQQIADLERRLDRESELREEENRRRDVILQQMTASIRLLTGPDRDVEVAQEARQRMDSRRPWWQRIFGRSDTNEN